MAPRSAIALFLAALVAGVSCGTALAQPRVRRHLQPTPSELRTQGFGPASIATTKDGVFAYLSFSLGETLFKIRLADRSVEAVTDLSQFFPMECLHIALDAQETTLFAAMPAWNKLAVVDARTMRLLRTIDGVDASAGLFRSRHANRLVAWNGGGHVWFVDTTSFEVTAHVNTAMFFNCITESPSDPGLWYVVFQTSPGYPGGDLGVYRYTTSTLLATVELPKQNGGNGAREIQPLPDESKIYVSDFGGWRAAYDAYGWLHAVDLRVGQSRAIAIPGGPAPLALGRDGRRLYAGVGWPQPDTDLVHVVDTATDEVVSVIKLDRTKYGWAQTQVNDLQIDPTDGNTLYLTNNDGNAFVRVRLDTGAVDAAHVLNREDWQPHTFAPGLAAGTGYVLLTDTASALALDPSTGRVNGVVQLPGIRAGTYQYGMAIESSGDALIAQGNSFLEVDLAQMAVLATRPLAGGTPGIWHFALSGDGTRIYSVTQDPSTPAGGPNQLVIIDRASFSVQATRHLEGGVFAQRPFELPGGKKLYLLGGWNYPGGAVVVHVVGTDDLTIRKTIVFDQAGLMGISAGPYFPFAFDPASQMLYVGATEVVLGIDTITDTITRVIRLADALPAAGLGAGRLTYLNAVGLVHHPQQNLLFIAHLDGSFLSIYDLNAGRFLPRNIPLRLLPYQGYFPQFLFTSPDVSTIFSINVRSDTISLIDTASQTVRGVIDLRDYLGSR